MTELRDLIIELREHLGPEGDYTIIRKDRNGLDLAEYMTLGKLLYDIDVALQPEDSADCDHPK